MSVLDGGNKNKIKKASFINQRAVCGGRTQGMAPTREEYCKSSVRSWRLANLVESRIRKTENALNFTSHTDKKNLSSRRLEKAEICLSLHHRRFFLFVKFLRFFSPLSYSSSISLQICFPTEVFLPLCYCIPL